MAGALGSEGLNPPEMTLGQKLAAVNTQSPEVVTALGDFYDGLNADQQAQVRGFLAKGGLRGLHGRRHGEERGEHRN